MPLVVFKREKEIARKLEFDGLYITEQPSDDDIKGQWDRLVINTPCVESSTIQMRIASESSHCAEMMSRLKLIDAILEKKMFVLRF